MKKLMYLSISMLCLAIILLIGFHIGSQSVKAQAPEAITGYRVMGNNPYHHFVMLSTGDVYFKYASAEEGHFDQQPPKYLGNFWTGYTIPTSPQSLGGLKSNYEK